MGAQPHRQREQNLDVVVLTRGYGRRRKGREVLRSESGETPRDAYERGGDEPSPFGRRVEDTSSARPTLKPEQMKYIETVLERAEAEEITRLELALPFLATTGATAPFIGLFGTVWGVMRAFQGIGATASTTCTRRATPAPRAGATRTATDAPDPRRPPRAVASPRAGRAARSRRSSGSRGATSPLGIPRAATPATTTSECGKICSAVNENQWRA